MEFTPQLDDIQRLNSEDNETVVEEQLENKEEDTKETTQAPTSTPTEPPVEDDRELDSWSHKILGLGPIKEALDHVSLGVGDTISDTIGTVGRAANIPWLEKVDDWWDGNSPTSGHPFHQGVRDASAIIIPTLVGQGVVIGGLSKLTKAKQISQATRTLGTIMAAAGVDVSVTAISSQSSEQDNAAGALNKWLGWNIPWGTTDSMSPEVRRKMHIYESAGLSVGVDLLQIIGELGTKLKHVDLDEKSANLLKQKRKEITKVVGEEADPYTEAIQSRRSFRETAQIEEGVKRLKDNVDDLDYDPFIHGGEEATRAVSDLDPDTLGAKVDLHRIQTNAGTIDGQMRTAASKAIQDILTNAPDGAARAKILTDYFENNLKTTAKAIVNNEEIWPAKLNDAVDKLTDSIFNPDISFNQFSKTVEIAKTVVHGSKRLLGEEEWIKASNAFRRAYDRMLDPDLMRASAINTQQAADTITSTAKGADILHSMDVTTTRQQQLINEKMKLLVGEVFANQEIARRTTLINTAIEQGDPKNLTEFLISQADEFDEAIATAKSNAASIVDTLDEIALENPEYLRPLIEAYDATNGNVDTLYKLHKWAENKIGFIKKGIFDTNPEMPSFVIKGLHGVRYNSILSGLAPVRAVTGNAILSTIKPISTFIGAASMGEIGTLKRAMYTYGGFSENIKRGLKVLTDDWRLANSNPEQAMARGRADLKLPSTEQFEALESMAKVWRDKQDWGRLALWNWAKVMSHWNNNKFVRYGSNAMFAIDGFTGSLMASGQARAQAYDALLKSTNGSFSKQQFLDTQRYLYSQAFNSAGVLTDKAARHATQEIALNLDSGFVTKIEKILDHVPAAKALFLFPRTGANAFQVGWSFNPVSNLGPAITKANRTLSAVTTEEIAEILSEHGMEYSIPAFKQLQSEYLGRQVMGASVVMAAGLWALEGNLTGNGAQEISENQQMRRMGFKPKSIKHPITGQWHSYEGLEPFETLLGLVGDAVFYADRIDQAGTEDLLNKIRYSITMNIANDTFLSGFEPLVAMMNGDESAWNRFWAMQANTQVLPGAGIRTVLSNMVSPQLKDVENDWFEYLKNMNKYMVPNDPKLPDQLDIYTGEPIRYFEPFTAATNALLPFFKTNGGMEPWRQWLLSTGWSGLQRQRINTITGGPLTAEDRQWVNNWIAKFGGLKSQIIALMDEPDSYWDKELAKYRKHRGDKAQQDYPIKEILLHKHLDRIHDRVYTAAMSALAQFKEPYVHEQRLKRKRDYLLNKGAFSEAEDVHGDIKVLLDN